MVYEWKVPVFKVDANTAGAELERIYAQNGELDPAQVVEASRPKKAPLHDCFEWDDAIAAEKYREHQARHIIRSLVAYDESDDAAEPQRAYVSVQESYRPLEIVLASRDMSAELLQSAYRDMRTFETKYSELQELASVFDAMEEVMA